MCFRNADQILDHWINFLGAFQLLAAVQTAPHQWDPKAQCMKSWLKFRDTSWILNKHLLSDKWLSFHVIDNLQARQRVLQCISANLVAKLWNYLKKSISICGKPSKHVRMRSTTEAVASCTIATSLSSPPTSGFHSVSMPIRGSCTTEFLNHSIYEVAEKKLLRRRHPLNKTRPILFLSRAYGLIWHIHDPFSCIVTYEARASQE